MVNRLRTDSLGSPPWMSSHSPVPVEVGNQERACSWQTLYLEMTLLKEKDDAKFYLIYINVGVLRILLRQHRISALLRKTRLGETNRLATGLGCGPLRQLASAVRGVGPNDTLSPYGIVAIAQGR